MKKTFNISKSKILRAVKNATIAQESFETAVQERGKKVLANLPKNKKCFVILGRPYNTGDTMQNLSMVEKLINMDILPIPIDFLPLRRGRYYRQISRIYIGQTDRKLLQASRIVGRTDNLNAIYLGNFSCGPDSFIHHYVKKEIQNKPYLHLEVDEHSADAGMITRIEAFVDSLDGAYARETKKENLSIDHVQNPSSRFI